MTEYLIIYGNTSNFNEAKGSGDVLLEVWGIESKSAPADSRSMVSRLSNPSSADRARARHSSGAELDIVSEKLCKLEWITHSSTSAGKSRILVQ